MYTVCPPIKIMHYISKVDLPRFIEFFKIERIYCIVNPDEYDFKFGWTLEFGYSNFANYYNTKWSSKELGLWEKYLSAENQPVQLEIPRTKGIDVLYNRLFLFLKQKLGIVLRLKK